MTKKKKQKTESSPRSSDLEATVNLTGSAPELPLRDDLAPESSETETVAETESESVAETEPEPVAVFDTSHKHLRGLVEALVFASDQPIKPADIAKLAQAPSRQIKEVLQELKKDFAGRGVQLEEVAGGYAFRTNVAFAPFVRDLVGQKPVRLTRAQLETLAIVAYRQPVTRPDIDDVRGVDCGPVLRTLLERDLVRILGKAEEAGRPILYGTAAGFLELFGLKSLKDLPTLREFTELNEDSKRTVERELGETMETQLGGVADGPTDPPAPERPTLENAHLFEDADPNADHVVSDSESDAVSVTDSATITHAVSVPADEDEDDDDDDDDDDEDDWDDDDDDEDEDEDEDPTPE